MNHQTKPKSKLTSKPSKPKSKPSKPKSRLKKKWSEIQLAPIEDPEIFFSPAPVQLEPGQYYVIDPIYLFKKDQWKILCHELFSQPAKQSNEGIRACHYGLNGMPLNTVPLASFSIWNTVKEADLYPIYHRKELIGEVPVESGLLSLIPIALAHLMKKRQAKEQGVIVSISSIMTPHTLAGLPGDIMFGDYSVITSSDLSSESESESDSQSRIYSTYSDSYSNSYSDSYYSYSDSYSDSYS